MTTRPPRECFAPAPRHPVIPSLRGIPHQARLRRGMLRCALHDGAAEEVLRRAAPNAASVIPSLRGIPCAVRLRGGCFAALCMTVRLRRGCFAALCMTVRLSGGCFVPAPGNRSFRACRGIPCTVRLRGGCFAALCMTAWRRKCFAVAPPWHDHATGDASLRSA